MTQNTNQQHQDEIQLYRNWSNTYLNEFIPFLQTLSQSAFF